MLVGLNNELVGLRTRLVGLRTSYSIFKERRFCKMIQTFPGSLIEGHFGYGDLGDPSESMISPQRSDFIRRIRD